MSALGKLLDWLGAVVCIACLVLAVLCLFNLNIPGFLWAGVGVCVGGVVSEVGKEMNL